MKKKKNTYELLNGRLAFGFLAVCVTLIAVMLAAAWVFPQKSAHNKTEDYYPAGVFKIPEEVMKERIATVSARTVRIPIIMYHYVEYVDRAKDPGRANLATSPFYLEANISSLKAAKYYFLFARDVPEIVDQKQSLPAKPVVLTFDDGYEDFYYNAMPVLKKYSVKATIYVIADYIGRNGYLNLEELKEIRDSGLVEIGAHTLNHAYLKDMKPAAARKEILDSKTKLESLLGIGVPSFAYPYGAFSRETLQLTKEAGYTNAVSVIPGVNQSEDNLFYLFRLRPGNLGGPDPAKSLAAYK